MSKTSKKKNPSRMISFRLWPQTRAALDAAEQVAATRGTKLCWLLNQCLLTGLNAMVEPAPASDQAVEAKS